MVNESLRISSDMPGRRVALVDGEFEVCGVDVDGSTVSVVVLTGGGAASVVCDGAPLS